MTAHERRRFSERVAVVTGGASGIGEATVRQLHAEGASVVAGDVNAERLDELQRALGDRFVGVRCDVTQEDEVERLIGTAVERFGRLDAAFNVAGGLRGGPIHEMDEADWRFTVDLSLTGVFLSVKHEARQMIAQADGGAIVNVASICSQVPLYGGSAYCCAKAGVEMLTKVAALELGEHRIRVNAVSPGRTATAQTAEVDATPGVVEAWLGQTPIARMGQPEDVAAALLFLASDDAAHVSSANLVIDGAFCTTTFEPVIRPLRSPAATTEG
ncbi:MAG TPA: SDR family NAD(P)-dependent oxidoreductase [Conexibacter sp.]|nr:SDR family NAD(P)-dependent oxidoreductase [Conexibacter sp.]